MGTGNRLFATIESLEARRLFALGAYPTYAVATSDLQTWAASYPSISRLVSIGKTVQNRDIWAMEITDNPGTSEDEPEFLYEGSIHGDEPVGMENCFYLINHLLTNYGSDSRITSDVNNTDIWIIPNLNWDGYSRSPSAWRYNANAVDLNRNFPEWVTGGTPSSDTIRRGAYGNLYDGPAMNTTSLQPEVVAMMNFRAAHRFVASANLHTGSLVANYPYDTNGNGVADYSYSPDENLFKQMALTYSRQNTPMYNSTSFSQGVTNGDHWYEVYGGMQDWSYLYTGCNEITIELSTTKTPAAANLPTLWNNNRESMLQYMETASTWGVRGIVTDGSTGLPLSAKITLNNYTPSPTPDPNHPASHAVFSDPSVGDYYRMLLPGTYSLTIAAPGYQSATVSNIVVSSGAMTRADVGLIPIDTTPPTVLTSAFNYNAARPSITFRFSENVSASLSASDLTLTNLTSGSTVPGGALLLEYASATNVATFTFPGLSSGILEDGYYRATLAAGSVSDPSGNALAADVNLSFFSLAGDANHDGAVDVTDLGVLATNWQGSGAFADGDFNYDGVVDVTDLGILATNWQKTLAAPAAASLALPKAMRAARIGQRLADGLV